MSASVENTWYEKVAVLLFIRPAAKACANELLKTDLASWRTAEDRGSVKAGYAGPKRGQFCAEQMPAIADKQRANRRVVKMAIIGFRALPFWRLRLLLKVHVLDSSRKTKHLFI